MKIIVPIFLLLSTSLLAQNTVGILSLDSEQAYEGYNLLFPHNQSTVFLVNNCGEIVNMWEDEDVLPGNSVYLTDNGNLIKCKRRTTSAVNDPIWAGGGGEIVEIRTFENDFLASFELNDSTARLHHDVAPMPNGNILMIAWEYKSLEETIAAGRDTSLIAQDKLWPEMVLEWDPTTDEIVWQWHVWDHLIQDYDSDQLNFGNVAEHPELIDLNYDEHDGHPDWLHFNAIDYNPVLDQIVLSVPYFNELWIIDHSTSTVEAASHAGGNSGKGGDLLYRWGNPQTYLGGTSEDQLLFFQHDVHWTAPFATQDDDNFGQLILYNNRVGANFSTSNLIDTNWDSDSQSYSFENGAFSPMGFSRTVSNMEDDRSNSTSLSSAQLLPNGNFLVCAGRWGYSYEITPTNEIVWEYITPIKMGQRANQGDTLSISNNITFRVKRYGKDFVGFEDKELESLGFIESNPDTSFCRLTTPTVDITLQSLEVFPVPASSVVNLISVDEMIGQVEIYTTTGRFIHREEVNRRSYEFDIYDFQKGVYFIKTKFGVVRFIKI